MSSGTTKVVTKGRAGTAERDLPADLRERQARRAAQGDHRRAHRGRDPDREGRHQGRLRQHRCSRQPGLARRQRGQPQLGRARQVRVGRQPARRSTPTATTGSTSSRSRPGTASAARATRSTPPRPSRPRAPRCSTTRPARVSGPAGATCSTRPGRLPVVDDGLLGPAEIRALASRLGIRPTKSLGQNFVIDPNTVRRIVRLAEVGPEDVVVEVGPGLGSLTLGLLDVVRRVVAVEIDPVLAAELPRDRRRPAPGPRRPAHRARAGCVAAERD